jgi:RHS repeat-associated protein
LGASNLGDRYLWGPAVDQLLAQESPLPLGEGQGEGFDLSTPGSVLWALGDNENTVRDLASYNAGTGATTIADHRVYDAFGVLKSQTAAVDCLFGYTGRPFDAATGLQNNTARWYDPIVGRWLSEDPIGFNAGDADLYRYCGNGPTDAADPAGNQWFNPFSPGAWWNPIKGFANVGDAVGGGLGTWASTPSAVDYKRQKDGSTEFTVNGVTKGHTIVLAIGHGNRAEPHSFKFTTGTSHVGFVGCDADATNLKIPGRYQIPGLGPISGELRNWRTDAGVDALDLARRAAAALARQLIASGGADTVTIIEVRPYPGIGLNVVMPARRGGVVTRDNLEKKLREYTAPAGCVGD